ncbi:MFS general substrate transporter [Venturia nashicola]|uniref:MFS general substrate transporter n=1 Tax=Venturia nashicola TaxID=86259 RepID=A0A4Z1NLT9_9PEZI|nr:MFS general substrate transporter [Venturia nashicola]TLD21572.1 MFS general substrate transporter [Venturia nashicola]
MEKEIRGTEPIRPTSKNHGFKEPEIRTEGQQEDSNANSLSRIDSGPPYSIFTTKAKIFIVILVSVSALVSPFAATLFYPALNVLAVQLHVSESLITLSVTTYMLAQAVAPAFLAGISDQSGRRFSFLICFGIYICANIGLALQTNYAALLVLRCLQACGSSATIALTIAVVADVATSSERGTYMGYATSGILLGPAFGPVLGGALAEFLGWRSIFWFLAIFGGVLLILFGIFFPETCRNVVGNGSIPARGVNRSVLGYMQQRKRNADLGSLTSKKPENGEKRKLNIPNPLRTLKILGEKESALVLLYNGFFFNGQMIVSAGLPYMLKQAYGYNELKIGLCFITLGFGCLTSALSMGPVVDWRFRVHAKRVGLVIIKGKQQDLRDFPIERARIEVVVPNHAIGTLALIAFGWTIQYRLHIAVPEVILFFVGFGISSAFNTTSALLIDLHRDAPATATAAVNFVRCLISAGGVAAIVPMIEAMNPGWTFTFIGLLYVVWMPMLWIIMKWGPKWRAEKQAKKDLEAAEKGRMDTATAHSSFVNLGEEEKAKLSE